MRFASHPLLGRPPGRSPLRLGGGSVGGRRCGGRGRNPRADAGARPGFCSRVAAARQGPRRARRPRVRHCGIRRVRYSTIRTIRSAPASIIGRFGARPAVSAMTDDFVRRCSTTTRRASKPPDARSCHTGRPISSWRRLRRVEPERQDFRFGRVLDLGCGTGLMGEAMRHVADISRAATLAPHDRPGPRQGVYDRLAVDGIEPFLAAEPGGRGSGDRAADVLPIWAIWRPSSRQRLVCWRRGASSPSRPSRMPATASSWATIAAITMLTRICRASPHATPSAWPFWSPPRHGSTAAHRFLDASACSSRLGWRPRRPP